MLRSNRGCLLALVGQVLLLHLCAHAGEPPPLQVTEKPKTVKQDKEIDHNDAERTLPGTMEELLPGFWSLSKAFVPPLRRIFLEFPKSDPKRRVDVGTDPSGQRVHIKDQPKDGDEFGSKKIWVGSSFRLPLKNAGNFPLKAEGNLGREAGLPSPEPTPGGAVAGDVVEGTHWSAMVEGTQVEFVVVSKNATTLLHPTDATVPEWGAAWVSRDPVIRGVQGERRGNPDFVILEAKIKSLVTVPIKKVAWDGDGQPVPGKPLQRRFPRNAPKKNEVTVKIDGQPYGTAVVWVVKAGFPNDAFANSGRPRSRRLRIVVFSGAGNKLGFVVPEDGAGQFVPTPPIFIGGGFNFQAPPWAPGSTRT